MLLIPEKMKGEEMGMKQLLIIVQTSLPFEENSEVVHSIP